MSTISVAVVLPEGAVPNRHVLYRKYAGLAITQARQFARSEGVKLSGAPPVFVRVEPMKILPGRSVAVFEVETCG